MAARAFIRDNSLNIFTAALIAVAVWRLGLSPELPAVAAFIVGGVLLAVIDWKVQRLPTRLVYATLAGVGAGLVFAALVERNWQSLATAIVGGVLMANAFFLVWLVTTRMTGMAMIGFGDVRLAAVLGLLLGWYGLPTVLYGVLAGHALALLVAVVACVRERKVVVRYSFGPPLIAGTLAVVLIAG